MDTLVVLVDNVTGLTVKEYIGKVAPDVEACKVTVPLNPLRPVIVNGKEIGVIEPEVAERFADAGEIAIAGAATVVTASVKAPFDPIKVPSPW